MKQRVLISLSGSTYETNQTTFIRNKRRNGEIPNYPQKSVQIHLLLLRFNTSASSSCDCLILLDLKPPSLTGRHQSDQSSQWTIVIMEWTLVSWTVEDKTPVVPLLCTAIEQRNKDIANFHILPCLCRHRDNELFCNYLLHIEPSSTDASNANAAVAPA